MGILTSALGPLVVSDRTLTQVGSEGLQGIVQSHTLLDPINRLRCTTMVRCNRQQSANCEPSLSRKLQN
jgi:hypothetical protein